MKHSVLDFMDSDTLREMLRGKQLEPAVECILIARSEKQSMERKLAALSERADAYSDADFQKGIFNMRKSDCFADSLRRYIHTMRHALDAAQTTDAEHVFQTEADNSPRCHLFRRFSDAADFLRGSESDARTVTRRKIDDTDELPITYHLNDDCEIASVTLYAYSADDIADAFAELPHSYRKGDLIVYNENYYVIANICRAHKETCWLKHSDSTDMQLYCFGYDTDDLHSCGGSFGHAHIPILQAELALEEDVPDCLKPLLALRLMLRDEMKCTDFLESYCSRSLSDLMKYYKRRSE